MSSEWPALSYEEWSETCDTLHAHTQVLGKLAVALAPPEPQLQHAALRLTARGWETAPLPAPDGSGALVVALDLRTHEASSSTATGRASASRSPPTGRSARSPARCWTRCASLAGAVEIDPTPQEVPWSAPLDEDDEHARYDPAQVAAYFAAATRPRSSSPRSARRTADARRRSTPGGARSTSPSTCSRACRPIRRRTTSSCATRWTRRRSPIGWWPGDPRYGKAAFYAYAHPAPEGFAAATLSPPAARWDATLGEYILDWDDVRASPDPHAAALEFARSAFRHACAVCEWDPALAASAEGTPPPVA